MRMDGTMMMKANNLSYSRVTRRGFSFTEILFAVMVLGVGFIMIAAMFPVVISQTQSTLSETNGSMQGRAALAYLGSVATEETFQPTVKKADFEKDRTLGPNPPVRSLSISDDAQKGYGTFAIRGNFVSSGNPRFGWVPIYRRGRDADGTPWPYAQVMMIPVQARVRTQYHTSSAGGVRSDLATPDANTPANLGLRPVQVTLKRDATDGTGRLTFSSGWSGAAVSGAYVVVADGVGTAPGRVYQLAEELTPGTWSLSASGDMKEKESNANLDEDKPITSAVDAYIVGRSFANPDAPDTTFAGNAQDVGIYVGFVRVPSNSKTVGQ
jgi:hypothetical protein